MTDATHNETISYTYDELDRLRNANANIIGGANIYNYSYTYNTIGNILSAGTTLAPTTAGYEYTCAITTSGGAMCWGNNNQGQLGTAGAGRSDLVAVPGATGMIAIGVGTLHTCAMRSPTEIFCWGGNSTGQLGDGTTRSTNVPVEVKLP